ncbi:helicase-associated domain-containing protein [Cohnella caldifontis]|uniref:helicase-associated domain-containing protein n=1 Tax=Cohnella caldifontis TaxID=3027471 RepID=UPI0023ED10FA|nr:helicase-associated domain-containing protein [Cohnella sp. YIM B05605]
MRDCVAGLPESVRRRILSDPAVRDRVSGGMELPDVLSSPEWAAEWASRADRLRKEALRRILLVYGATAFEEEKSEEEALRDGRWTGAEWRVALAGLRLTGILYAIRKTWGDRLYFVPADMAAVWQRLLLPAFADPLDESEARETAAAAAPFRLPLSLELLSAWSAIRRAGLPLTSKGAVSKPSAARLVSAMRLTAEELEPLGLAYPYRDQLPVHAALALDLGLCTGVLRKRDREISVSAAGAEAWMARSAQSADAELYRMAMLRYAVPDPGRHLAAAAVCACRAFEWYRDRDFLRIGIAPSAWEVWMNLLVSFGWAERGTFRGEAVFRLLAELGDARTPEDRESRTEEGFAERFERFLVQPDGEIFVPPGVGLAERWQLEAVSERVTADRMFVYRLTAATVRRAYDSGWREGELRRFLERGSGAALPGPVEEALRDWFRALGKVRVVDAMLLRTEDAGTAERLLQDEEAAGWLLERVGDRDFIVDPAHAKELVARLEKIGFPPAPDRAEGSEPGAGGETEADAGTSDPGWIYTGSVPSLYRQDGTLETAGRLFPGLSDVPPGWLRQTGSYHSTTRRELVRRALDWRAALQVGEDGGRLFVPDALETSGDGWQVRGRWGGPDGAEEPDTLPADRCSPLRIVLPDLEPLPFADAPANG